MGNSSTILKHKYTWNRDIPSKNDKFMKFEKTSSDEEILAIGDPYKVPISTTTDAVSLVFEYTMGIQNISRTYLYWNSRDESPNTSINKTLRSIQKYGWVKGESWYNRLNYINYDPNSHSIESNRVNLKIRKIRVKDIRSAISEGYPVIFGFTVYNEELTYPKDSDNLLGGLAGIVYGYNEDTYNVRTLNEDKVFEKRYIEDDCLSFDFWIMYSEGKCSGKTKKYTIVDDSSDEDEEL